MNGDKKVATIPKIYRCYTGTKAVIDALTGLKDGDIGWASDTTLLYRQSGDGSANWVAITSVSVATKEAFFPATLSDDARGVAKGNYCVAEATGSGDIAYVTFNVPHDFIAITECVLVISPQANNGAQGWDIYSSYATIGEADTTHQESDLTGSFAITANQLIEVDVSGILSALQADDLVGIRITNPASNCQCYLLGVRLKYS